MNVLKSQFRIVSSITGNLLQVNRGYAVQKKLPINWVMPEKIPCIDPRKSGDGGIDLQIKPDDFLLHYDKSEELKNADEIVKRMFSLEFNPRRELVQLKKLRTVQRIHRHSHDFGSMEARIAKLTARILQLQEHQKIHYRNKKTKVILKELIEKRKKWLKKLRIHDYGRFEYLLEKLNLVYHPYPEENPRLSIKGSTRGLLQKYCDELVKKKLSDYKEELEKQQKDFFTEKANQLEFIRNEEIACGVTPTVTEEEIEAAKQKAASFT